MQKNKRQIDQARQRKTSKVLCKDEAKKAQHNEELPRAPKKKGDQLLQLMNRFLHGTATAFPRLGFEHADDLIQRVDRGGGHNRQAGEA